MEAQTIALHHSFQSATHLAIQNRLISPSSSSNWVSLKRHPSLSSQLVSKRSFNHKNVVLKVAIENGASSLQLEEDEEKLKPRRKNLAVFVSGGGSNFKSIYEATVNGDVHGDVVVLVTNNPGILCFELIYCSFS